MNTKRDTASSVEEPTANVNGSQLTTATPLAWCGDFYAPDATVTSWAICETNLKPWKEQRSTYVGHLLYRC